MAEKNISVPVLNLGGEKVGTLSLSAEVFGIEEKNSQVVHDAIVTYMANRRQATAKTKKRHEVSGGGKKPWRQKGTGRARAGSSRSPIWVGGGTVFGPDGNQCYKLSQNKKAHALAMKTVLSQKAAKGLIVVDKLEVPAISTKEFAKDLTAIKAEGKTLVVIAKDNENVALSARAIEGVTVLVVGNVSVYDLANAANVVIGKDEIQQIEEGLK